MDFFDQMEPLLKTYWFVAAPVTVIFLIQTVMTFTGLDSADGIEADFEGDLTDSSAPFQLFSLRNLINFLLGFSWSGISLYQTFENPTLLVLFSLLTGGLFVYFFFLIISKMQKLAEDNSFRMAHTVNQTAEVYIPIPERKSGKGRVLLSIKGSVRELDAMTERDRIAPNTLVRVVKIENERILIVEPL